MYVHGKNMIMRRMRLSISIGMRIARSMRYYCCCCYYYY